MKKVLFFGDSLTAGYGLISPKADSLPALLAAKAEDEGLPFQYINAGVSGDTTDSALSRLHKLLELPSDIYVVALGANDMIRGNPAVRMSQNLDLILLKIKGAAPDAKILLLGMELPSWITANRTEQYRNLYGNLAIKYDLTHLPFLLEGVIGKPELNLQDLVHPNAAGYKQIAERVWPLLRPLLT